MYLNSFTLHFAKKTNERKKFIEMQKKVIFTYTFANFDIEKYTEAGVQPIQIQPPNEEVMNSI